LQKKYDDLENKMAYMATEIDRLKMMLAKKNKDIEDLNQ